MAEQLMAEQRSGPNGTPGMFKTTDGGATWSAINKELAGIIGTRTPIRRRW